MTLGVDDQGVPDYSVISEQGPVELLADTDPEGAKQVIADWLDGNMGDLDHETVQVVAERDAGTAVCRVEYVASGNLPAVQASPRLDSDSYPALFLGACD